MNEIDSFLTKCHKSPQSATKLITFTELFRASLPPEARWGWDRRRVIYELKTRGFPIGKRRRVTFIGGLSIDAPPAWTLEADGSLRLRAPPRAS
jgi:hypothetical protein